MREQAFDRLDTPDRPAVPAGGVGEAPKDARSVGAVQTHTQPVLHPGERQRLVPDHRGLLLLLGEEFGGMDQTAVGQRPKARHALVAGEVFLEIGALRVRVAFAAKADPVQVDDMVVGRRTRAVGQQVAFDPAGFVDQAAGGRPAAVVECRFVQSRQDGVKGVLPAHALSPGAVLPFTLSGSSAVATRP